MQIQIKTYSSFTRITRLVVILIVLLVSLFWSTEAQSKEGYQAPEKPRPSSFIYIPSVVLGGPTSPDWLIYLNSYRAMALLPPVIENTAWSGGGEAHSRYTVKNDVVMHNEDSSNPWFTAEGLAAAQSGNLMGSYNNAASDRHAIDAWMQAPFHALGILDPALREVGYGSYRELDGGLQMGATLDILRGLRDVPATVTFPVIWPANGVTVPIGRYWGESPDPLTACPGYSSPSGLPVILQIGPGNLTPAVSSFSFSQGSTVLESCLFTETTYTHPDPDTQHVARAILNERDAIILIPRLPLTSGSTYTVSITANGQTYTWSFTVGGESKQHDFMLQPGGQ